jgi:hypothetical protein
MRSPVRRSALWISVTAACDLLGGCSLNQFRGPRQVAVEGCGDQALIEDAEDGDDQILLREGRGGYLYTFADKTGTTVLPPESAFAVEAGGTPGSRYAVHVSGHLASGDVYAGIGFDFTQGSESYDASHYGGIGFAAKINAGAEPHVRFMVADVNTDPKGKVCTKCDNDFGIPFKPTGEWTRYEVPFAELKQEAGWGSPRPPAIDTAKLMGAKWQFSAPNANFDLWLDDVMFLGCPAARQTATVK